MPVKRVNKIVIATNNLGSQSLKRLAETISGKVGYKVWRVTPERVRGRKAAEFPRGIDKLTQFRAFERAGINCPKYTTEGTQEGLSRICEGFKEPKVVARKLLNSSSGKGIEIFALSSEVIPRAPLYTQYIPKKKEFRVHVYNQQTIDVTEKRKRRGFGEERDTQVRNTANGYVFCRDGITVSDTLRDLALSAVQALGRAQGAVDIIWNEKQDKYYVLEVNSNPGMEGTTLEKYANAIIRQHIPN